MKLPLLSLGIALLCSIVQCAPPYPFMDPELPWEARVDDLVRRLTLEEVQNQTISGGPTSGIPRLGIPPYPYSTECIRGQVGTNATGYPHSIGLGATFNKRLIFEMAEAISHEARAFYNGNRKQGQYLDHQGLSCFSPVINIARHPLWGRNQETYGECPYLSGELVENFVRGLQGDNERYVRVNAGCKHFDVHGGPENIPTSRFSFDAKVSTQDWRMTFLPAFRKCVKAGTYSLMCSYNRINGIPACANKELMTDIARNEWGFKGYVVSDCGAIINIMSQHHYTNSCEDTVAIAIKAGCNIELCPGCYGSQLNALKQGKINEAQLRENIKPLIYTRMRLGLFDPIDMDPWRDVDYLHIQSPSHRAIALKAAMQSFVLLKNVDNLLPLRREYPTISVVGPMANNSDQMFGDYASNTMPEFTSTPLEALRTLGQSVNYAAGCTDTKCATGAPIILVLFNAGPLDISYAKMSPSVPAILEVFFPAQSSGQALYNVLTMTGGPDSVPAGRLPMTWPASMSQVPPMTDYTMKGRTYRYYEGEPLYPFGFGLSYTQFIYRDLELGDSVWQGDVVSLKVQVENMGPYEASEVIQVYLSWPSISIATPKLQLVAFERVYISIYRREVVEIIIKPDEMAVWMDNATGWHIPKGEYTVYVGGQQPGQKTDVGSNVLYGTFSIKERPGFSIRL